MDYPGMDMERLAVRKEHLVMRLSLGFVGTEMTILALLSALPSLAAPPPPTVNFTPPLANAKTIQVTETVFQAGNGSAPGPLHPAGTMTICLQRPNRFRVVWKDSDPSQPMSVDISDGKTQVSNDGKQTHSQPTAQAEWPFPLTGLLNNAPGPVQAVPGVRDGRKVLMAVRSMSPMSRTEYWFDPQTHLLLRDSMFLTWQGKTSEVMRTEYLGWVLDKPLPPSMFRLAAPPRQDGRNKVVSP